MMDYKTKERYYGCIRGDRGVARIAEKPRQENSVLTEERIMQEHGLATAEQLRQYSGITALTEAQAKDILTKLVPGAEGASPVEVFKAARICQDYGLNPLMNHIFLVPFQKKDKDGNVIGETYATVLGIRATRLIASRKHAYSYIDFTPRKMTEDEERKIYGDVDPSQITALTTLKDMKTGATASGYGRWPKMKNYGAKSYENRPQGTDKGNSMENMAMIRSERSAFDRLYPADMPGTEVQTIDESEARGGVIAVTVEQSTGERTIDASTGEIVAHVEQVSGSLADQVQTPSATEIAKEFDKLKSQSGTSTIYPTDPATIKTQTDLMMAANKDFKLQPPALLKELNLAKWSDMTETPRSAYIRIASPRIKAV